MGDDSNRKRLISVYKKKAEKADKAIEASVHSMRMATINKEHYLQKVAELEREDDES